VCPPRKHPLTLQRPSIDNLDVDVISLSDLGEPGRDACQAESELLGDFLGINLDNMIRADEGKVMEGEMALPEARCCWTGSLRVGLGCRRCGLRSSTLWWPMLSLECEVSCA
jgi:hypothetical protein